MDKEECERLYLGLSEEHADDVSTHLLQAKQKRALECMLMRDVIYSQFGIRFEYSTALSDFLELDGKGDGGCDQHIIDHEGERVILIQSKMSDIKPDGSWSMDYHMTAGELGRIEQFVDSVMAKTAKSEVSAVTINRVRFEGRIRPT